MKELITINSWRLGSFNTKNCPTDFYYTKVAQRFYDILRLTPFGKDCDKFICAQMALTLTHYLEDVISDFGLWAAFISKHRELYGKYLPFYTIDEENYYSDEINPEDVRFLIWMVLQKSKDETFYNPENPYLCEAADKIYAEMEKLFEKAPINEDMIPEQINTELFNDFFYVKSLCTKLMETYLIAPFTDQKRMDVEKSMEDLLADLNDQDFNYAVDSILLFNKKTGPLNLYAKDWLAALLAHWGKEVESKQIAAIESLPYDIYRVESYDDKTLMLETATDDEIMLPRNSFNNLPDATLAECKHFLAALTKYQGTWQTNGITSWLNASEAFQTRKEQGRPKDASLNVNLRILEANSGYPLLYFKDYQEFYDWMEQHIGFDKKYQHPKDFVNEKYLAVYVPQEKDMAVMVNGALIIKDERNPYYDRVKAEEEGINYLVSSETVADEPLHYLIDHHQLPDACINSIHGLERGKQLVQENIDFIARFMRVSNY